MCGVFHGSASHRRRTVTLNSPSIASVIRPWVTCCGSSLTPGSPRQPISSKMGMLETAGAASDMRGFTMLPSPEFCNRKCKWHQCKWPFTYSTGKCYDTAQNLTTDHPQGTTLKRSPFRDHQETTCRRLSSRDNLQETTLKEPSPKWPSNDP